MAVDARSLVEVYARAFLPGPYRKSKAEVEEFAEYLPIHSGQPGYRITIARHDSDNQLIGFAYGRKASERIPWTTIVAGPLAEAGLSPWLTCAYQLVEMAVDPAFQGQGVGARLHDRLLAGLQYERALLTTLAGSSAPADFYRRKGWQVLVATLQVPNLPRKYQVMGLELGRSEGTNP